MVKDFNPKEKFICPKCGAEGDLAGDYAYPFDWGKTTRDCCDDCGQMFKIYWKDENTISFEL
jgi:hypothetical protein